MKRGGALPKFASKEKEKQPFTLFQAFARSGSSSSIKRTQKDDNELEVIVIEDSSNTPSTSSAAPRQKCPSYSATVDSNDRKKRKEDVTSLEKLQSYGADSSTLNSIGFCVGELPRAWEREAARKACQHNAIIATPSDSNASHLIATVLWNFLRWFPRCLCVCTCSSVAISRTIQERCLAIGISQDDITISENATAAKKQKKQHGVWLCPVKTLETMLQSNSGLSQKIRCLVLRFDAAHENITKYRKAIDAFNKPFYRLVAVLPSTNGVAAKSSAVSARQQLITNLSVSEWIEYHISMPIVRARLINRKVGPIYWEDAARNEQFDRWIVRWSEVCAQVLSNLLEVYVDLPSIVPEQLFYLDWPAVKEVCNSPVVASAFFLVEALRILILSGPRVFYLFCHNALSKSEELQLLMFSKSALHDIYQEVEASYGGGTKNCYDITGQASTVISHPKWERLMSVVQDYTEFGRPIKGVILCESAWSAQAAVETLHCLPHNNEISMSIISAVLNDRLITDETLRKRHRTLQALPLALREPGSVLAVVRTDLPLVLQTLDQLCRVDPDFFISVDLSAVCWLPLAATEHIALLSRRYEALRPTDGHEPNEFLDAKKHQAQSTSATAAVQKFSFDFHPSALCLDVAKMHTHEYYHCSTNDTDEPTNLEPISYVMTNAQRAIYDRMAAGAALPQPSGERPKLPTFKREHVLMNSAAHWYLGEVPSSTCSRYLARHLSSRDNLLPSEFPLIEKPEAIARRQQIESLIAEFDALFPEVKARFA